MRTMGGGLGGVNVKYFTILGVILAGLVMSVDGDFYTHSKGDENRLCFCQVRPGGNRWFSLVCFHRRNFVIVSRYFHSWKAPLTTVPAMLTQSTTTTT